MEGRPVESFRNDARSVEWRFRLLVGHLEKQQKRQLLDVVLVRQAIVPKDVAVVPELLDDRRAIHAALFLVPRALRLRPVSDAPLRLRMTRSNSSVAASAAATCPTSRPENAAVRIADRSAL